ncbi:DUF4142 domain-containing protein [Acetobacter oeni]|uniref:DUF4142 domain-containing protein n=1 Tax=Acetobacter oeni TaxID=304077 RepID=A0A511XGV0_9PROT|nr:DUF4142 domain-containing protein [Acetobacter oeni]MBB3882311.1 putative membrane protein [Acetobacter oeni]GBR02185.1 hypothetical protein AA21952_0663 [Acetobacter oeni LMG 21952]GEN62173.1 hypothetical protein AOE01nite_03970 [Acetobacter oeni]
MKTVNKIITLVALASLSACAAKPPAPPPPPPALSDTDAAFIQKASEINLVEIELGKAAATNAKSAAVKSYAQTLVTDHSSAQDRLSTIATSHGITLPTAPDESDEKDITTLTALKGGKFDHAYIGKMVAGHTEALPVMTEEASSSTDADLKSYAQDTSTTVQQHLDAAKALQSPTHHSHKHRH